MAQLTVLAIDPGPTESAFVHWDGERILNKGALRNEGLLEKLRIPHVSVVVIEMIASYGMPVGAEVFETCVWIGRFMEAACPAPVHRLPRLTVKQHLCHDSRAKDANIRAALIDRFGGPAAIRKGGALYGVHGDCWAALAVGVTWWDLHHAGEPPVTAVRGVVVA